MTHFLCSFDLDTGDLHSDSAPVAAPDRRSIFLRGAPVHAGRRGAVAVAAAISVAGAGFAAQLDGAFAAVIHLGTERRLLAAVDDVGTASMFYAERSRTLFISSSLERLVGLLRPEDYDETYLLEYLLQGWCMGKRTPFRDVTRLLPGEVLTAASRSLFIQKNWSLAKTADAGLNTPDDAIAAFQDAFNASIRMALPDAGPIWAELSGGLDSSSVLLGALKAAPGRVDAVSVIYPASPRADEQPWMRPVIEQAQVPWHLIDGDECCTYTMDSDEFHAEPSLTLLSPGKHIRLRSYLAEAGASALLTGQGGDTVLFGDGSRPYHIADQLCRLAIRHAHREAVRYDAAAPRPLGAWHWLIHCGLKPAWRHWRGRPVDQDARPAPWLTADALRKATHLVAESTPEQDAAVTRVSKAQYLYSVRRSSRFVALGSQHDLSCEMRHPLLSRNLVAFMLSLPDRFKTHPEMDRPLQRHALRALLPQETVLRRSKGGPDEAHFKALGRSRVWQRRLSENCVLVQRGYVEQQAWTDAVMTAANGAVTDLPRFQATASLETWFKQLHRLQSEPVPALAPVI